MKITTYFIIWGTLVIFLILTNNWPFIKAFTIEPTYEVAPVDFWAEQRLMVKDAKRIKEAEDIEIKKWEDFCGKDNVFGQFWTDGSISDIQCKDYSKVELKK